MVMVKSLDYVRGSLLFLAQIGGSCLASVLVRALFPTRLNVRTTLSADTSKARGVFIEAILTAELVFTIFMLAKEKHRATYMAPVGIGLSLFIAELVGVFYTGGSLNPARSFGPCAVTGIWDNEHWVYWLGEHFLFFASRKRSADMFDRSRAGCYHCSGVLQVHQDSGV